MKRKISKATSLQITAWSLAGLTLGAGLVYFNFIDKDKFLPLEIGEIVDNFKVATYDNENGVFIDGEEFELFVRRDKILIVNLWELWCSSCVAELSEFNEFYEEYNEYVEVLALAGTTSSVSEIKSWLNNDGWEQYAPGENWREFTIKFACQYVPEEVSKLLGYADILPRTVIIDKDGVAQYADDIELNKAKLEEIVLPLLG